MGAEPESAIVVLVPEADALVGPFRATYDPSAAAGMPAHVTVLYPFVPPPRIDAQVVGAVQRTIAPAPPFAFTLVALRRFPGVLYLAPEPDEPFRRLTAALWRQFPDCPPYRGRHADTVPHLTVAHRADDDHPDHVADAITQAMADSLPIRAVARHLALVDSTSGRWRTRATLPLGTNRRPPTP